VKRLAALTWLVLATAAAVPAGAQGFGDLETGIRAYMERGDARAAILQIGDALDRGAVPPSARARAHVYMAHAFLALGDTLSALPHVERAIAVAPCVLPPPHEAPPEWIALYERSRPEGVTCAPRVISATLQSMLVPGWGQRSLGRRTEAAYFFAGTIAAAGGAVLFLQKGERRYAQYQTSTSYPELVELYDQAQRSRRLGQMLGATATAAYLWNLVDVARLASAHDRALAAARPLASVLPTVTPTADGATVALKLRLAR
jgi:hypothetical protein